MRIIVVLIGLTASTLLVACVNSERFRSNLGGPAAAADVEKDASK